MRISPEKMNAESRAIASAFVEGQPLELSSDATLDDFAWGNLNVSSHSVGSGKTGITINRSTVAPDQGSLSSFEPSGESVELLYSKNGQLEAVRDIPTGYDAQWSIERIADSILPERRKQRQERVVKRSEALVHAAQMLIANTRGIDK